MNDFERIQAISLKTREVPSTTTADIYIVLDGPPGPESGRFVEVEDENGCGLGPSFTGADWHEREDGCWVLGPFASVHDSAR